YGSEDDGGPSLPDLTSRSANRMLSCIRRRRFAEPFGALKSARQAFRRVEGIERPDRFSIDMRSTAAISIIRSSWLGRCISLEFRAYAPIRVDSSAGLRLPALRAEATLRCTRINETHAYQRAAGFTRRQTGGLHGADHRSRSQRETVRNLRCSGERRNTGANHARGHRERPSSLVARQQAHSVHLQPVRLLAGLVDERRWIAAEACSESFHRSRGRVVQPRRKEVGIHQRSVSELPGRQLQQAAARRGEERSGEGANLHFVVIPALDEMAQRAPQSSVRDSGRWRPSEGSHAWKSRRSAVLAWRSGRLRDLAGFD